MNSTSSPLLFLTPELILDEPLTLFSDQPLRLLPGSTALRQYHPGSYRRPLLAHELPVPAGLPVRPLVRVHHVGRAVRVVPEYPSFGTDRVLGRLRVVHVPNHRVLRVHGVAVEPRRVGTEVLAVVAGLGFRVAAGGTGTRFVVLIAGLGMGSTGAFVAGLGF